MSTQDLAVTQPEEPVDEAGPDLDDSALYFNREISWVDFNDRVLQLAEDPERPAARAGEVRRDLHVEPRRVLHGPRRRPAGPGRRRRHDAGARRAHAAARWSMGSASASAALSTRLCRCLEHDLLPALAEHGIRIAPGTKIDRRRTRGAVRALQPPDLPGADAARRGARAAVPLHLQPVAIARGPAARPGHRAADLRAGQGAQGDAPAVRAGGGGGDDLRAARGSHRPPPRPAVPGDGDPRLRHLPGDPRRRLHGVRRGRRSPPGRRGRVAPPALRRGRARRGRRRDERGPARGADRGAGGRGARGLRRDGAARPQRPVADRQAAGLRPSCATSPGRRCTQPRLQDEDGEPVDVFGEMRRGDILVHHPYDSFVTSVERFVEQAVEDPDVLAIKQTVYRTSDDSPLGPGAHPRHRARQAGGMPGGAQGALRRAGEHPVGPRAGGGGRARRLRPSRR